MRKYFSAPGKAKGLLRVFLVILLMAIFILPMEAQGFLDEITWFGAGSILFFPENNGNESDPMPILPSPGLGISYPLTDFLKTELTLDFYLTHYGFSDKLGRPVPNAIENRTARVIGSVFALQAAAHFDLTSYLTLRVFGGPAADLRIVLVAANLKEGLDPMDDIRRQTNLVRNYFWSRGRWFLPVVGVGTDLTVNDRFRLGVDIRTWIPMYRIWTEENLPLVEGWRFGMGVRVTVQ
jgi:hypothetical protein